MVAPLRHGTRIGRPQPNGTVVLGIVVGPAFGEGFYRASFAHPEGERITCIHRDEVIVEPRFASLVEAAAALRARDQRAASDRRLRVAGGAF